MAEGDLVWPTIYVRIVVSVDATKSSIAPKCRDNPIQLNERLADLEARLEKLERLERDESR